MLVAIRPAWLVTSSTGVENQTLSGTGPNEKAAPLRVRPNIPAVLCGRLSALTGLVTRLGLVNHIDPALAAHDPAIPVAQLERAE